jgi:hypothetical protein
MDGQVCARALARSACLRASRRRVMRDLRVNSRVPLAIFWDGLPIDFDPCLSEVRLSPVLIPTP